jgi:hypothetical protein
MGDRGMARPYLLSFEGWCSIRLSDAATLWNCNASAALSMAKLDPTRTESAMITIVASMGLLVGLIAAAIATD